MADIQRYDPIGEMDDLFKGFFVRPLRFDFGLPEIMKIKMDVKQDDKAYTVSAELPGVKKEDVTVTVDGNQVAISAETKRQTEEKKGEQVIRSERYYGRIERSFTLDSDVDEAGSEAKYADGVLTLVLPKKGKPAGKQLKVN